MIVMPSLAFATFDQIHPNESLHGSLVFSAGQIFPDAPEFSSMVLDDLVLPGSITRVTAAFQLSDPSAFAALSNQVQGWRVSVFSDPAVGVSSGANLDQGALATQVVTDVQYAELGEIDGVASFTVDLTNLSINAGTGTRWIGVSAIMPLAANFQVFTMGNFAPSSFGGGGVDNAVFINPGEGFGSTYEPLFDNAAYRVEAVPEPTTLLIFGAGLLGTCLKKKQRVTGRLSESKEKAR